MRNSPADRSTLLTVDTDPDGVMQFQIPLAPGFMDSLPGFRGLPERLPPFAPLSPVGALFTFLGVSMVILGLVYGNCHGPRMSAETVAICLSRPRWQTTLEGMVPAFFLLTPVLTTQALMLYRRFFIVDGYLELHLRSDRVVAIQRGRRLFDVARDEARVVVEGNTLVLMEPRTEQMRSWSTNCSALALKRVLEAMQ